MELLVETGIIDATLLKPLMEETDQLVKILVSSLNTAKRHRSQVKKAD
jgi:hypothetical protein